MCRSAEASVIKGMRELVGEECYMFLGAYSILVPVAHMSCVSAE